MIYRVSSNDSRFKTVEFTSGLNIILADRALDSSKNDTRNGTGKTTLLNVIHFCLGADAARLDLPLDEMPNSEFALEFDLFGIKVTSIRSISNFKVVFIEGDTANFPIQPSMITATKTKFYSLEDWKSILGISLFGIEDDTDNKYSPSFRSLISFFIRKGYDAYSEPFKYFRSPKPHDTQINNAFLLGIRPTKAS